MPQLADMSLRELADPEIHRTAAGTAYLQRPGVAMVAASTFSPSDVQYYLAGMGCEEYLKDQPIQAATYLTKFAGQVCYQSFGPERSKNAEAAKYIRNILSSGHGSVLEHANVSFLVWGISRSLTHELVRHRAGFGFSQLSQRYVGADKLRFVERPEYAEDEWLHQRFEQRIDRVRQEYEELTGYMANQVSEMGLQESATERRKRVQQTSRSSLPNETETVMVVTANLRAWRHFLQMRAAKPAEPEIRRLAVMLFLLLQTVSQEIFQDFRVEHLADGAECLVSEFVKV